MEHPVRIDDWWRLMCHASAGLPHLPVIMPPALQESCLPDLVVTRA